MKKIYIVLAFIAITIASNAQTKTILGMGFSGGEGIGGPYIFGWGSNLRLSENLTFTAGIQLMGTSISDYTWTDSNTNSLTWVSDFLFNAPLLASLQYNYPIVKMEKGKQLGIFIEPMLFYEPFSSGRLGYGDLTINNYTVDDEAFNAVYNKFSFEVSLGVAYKYSRVREVQLALFMSTLDVFKQYRPMTINNESIDPSLPGKTLFGLKLIFAKDKF